ncbi:hypothetical protein ADL05_12840 [Nocardiopsis sp. NRRL B-16309]|nr:hypothetical protein ADL05_12840 [Nocardiopsis sp. NRRL B-16309]
MVRPGRPASPRYDSLVNDVALTSDGARSTDSARGELHLNRIQATADGRTRVVGHFADQRVHTIGPETGASTVVEGVEAPNTDGLVLHGPRPWAVQGSTTRSPPSSCPGASTEKEGGLRPLPSTLNYRTPAEVMAEAEPVIRAALPDANVPTSVRASGVPVVHGPVADLGAVLAAWLAGNAEGTACVIGAPGFRSTTRVRSLTPELAKGLEFDLVVLVDPQDFGGGIEGAVDRYVAMTRATRELVVLTGS